MDAGSQAESLKVSRLGRVWPPKASILRITLTVIRIPRIVGWPRQPSGATVILSSSLIALLLECPPYYHRSDPVWRGRTTRSLLHRPRPRPHHYPANPKQLRLLLPMHVLVAFFALPFIVPLSLPSTPRRPGSARFVGSIRRLLQGHGMVPMLPGSSSRGGSCTAPARPGGTASPAPRRESRRRSWSTVRSEERGVTARSFDEDCGGGRGGARTHVHGATSSGVMRPRSVRSKSASKLTIVSPYFSAAAYW